MNHIGILCVDDEENILHSLKRMLRHEPYRVFTANNSHDALRIIQDHEIQLVMTDQRMPEISGIELLQKIKEINPNIVRVVLSGYAEIHVVVEAVNQGEVFRFLAKPWRDEELKMDIRACLEQYALRNHNHKLTEELLEKNQKLEELNEALNQTIKERSEYLNLTQEVIDSIPFPILGIDKENYLVLINSAYCHFFDDKHIGVPGSKIDNFLPEAIVSRIHQFFDQAESSDAMESLLNDKPITIHLRALNHAEQVRGCLLLIEEIMK